ncbi:MAG: hypothetical protein JWQ42_1923, partial [Edaphobacter sp.]|nr:hypothetical protein [Edaphobacter sp.]
MRLLYRFSLFGSLVNFFGGLMFYVR